MPCFLAAGTYQMDKSSAQPIELMMDGGTRQVHYTNIHWHASGYHGSFHYHKDQKLLMLNFHCNGVASRLKSAALVRQDPDEVEATMKFVGLDHKGREITMKLDKWYKLDTNNQWCLAVSAESSNDWIRVGGVSSNDWPF